MAARGSAAFEKWGATSFEEGNEGNSEQVPSGYPMWFTDLAVFRNAPIALASGTKTSVY